MKKFLISSFALTLLFASNELNVNNINPNNTSKKQKIEQGWRFGDNPKSKPVVNDKKTIKEILAEMLKVQKEQLKTQKKILAILQEQFDPKPKMITLPNGKKCIANSSAECFQMPLTPIAKRIPVLKNWLEHRDIKSAAAYIKWQSKYMQEIFKSAYAYDFAVTEYGNKVAQLDYSRPGFEETFGASEVIRDKFKSWEINHYKDKFNLYIFLGENPDLDVYSFTSIARFFKKHPDLKYTIIFKTPNEKKAFLEAGKIFLIIGDMIKSKNVKMVVMPSLFKKLDVYTTPTISLKLKGSNVIHKVMVGRLNGILTSKIINFLKFKGIIKEGANPRYKQWDKVGNYAPEYYNHFWDVNINNVLKEYRKGEK